jgi:putative ABC transport system permease protein
MLLRSLRHRRARSFSALVAMTVSAAVATALLTLYADLDAKLHHEFRGFGANVVVTEGNAAADLVDKARVAGGGSIAAAFGYAVATTDRGAPVVVSGVDFMDVRRLDAWWQVAAWPTGTEDALLGSRAAEFVGNEKDVTLTFAGKTRTFHGVGRLKTGGDEDSRIYVPSAVFTEWTGVKPNVVEVQVPGSAAQVEAAMARLRLALPGAKVTPVRQLIDGESRIVDRTHALMFGAVLLIALTVAVSVLATLSASVLERRQDFALMKALGGREWQMTGLFLLETFVLAGAGIVGGYILGSGMAWVISETNFHTATLPRLSVLPFVVVLNVTIALLAAVLPMRALRGLEPAALLKGE